MCEGFTFHASKYAWDCWAHLMRQNMSRVTCMYQNMHRLGFMLCASKSEPRVQFRLYFRTATDNHRYAHTHAHTRTRAHTHTPPRPTHTRAHTNTHTNSHIHIQTQ